MTVWVIRISADIRGGIIQNAYVIVLPQHDLIRAPALFYKAFFRNLLNMRNVGRDATLRAWAEDGQPYTAQLRSHLRGADFEWLRYIRPAG